MGLTHKIKIGDKREGEAGKTVRERGEGEGKGKGEENRKECRSERNIGCLADGW